MTWSSFNLGRASHWGSTCVGAIAGLDMPLGDGVWLLGDRYDLRIGCVLS